MSVRDQPLRPFDARMLAVGDDHWIYVEEFGTRGGRPVVFLHGGPGSGAQHAHRALFDPAYDHAFLLDQRGAGRSHPYLSRRANTTQDLVNDLEIIREHFAIDRWAVVGGSWGSTLAVAYAEAHPDRVTAMVLRAVFLGTQEEVRWAFIDGPKAFRPDLFAAFRDWLPEDERDDILAAYVRRLTDSNLSVAAPAAQVWNSYERNLSEIAPAATTLATSFDRTALVPPTPIMEAHYIANAFFLRPGQLLDDAHRLTGIPGRIVQGRYDLLCPPRTAAALAAAWPEAQLQFIEGAGHAMTEPGVLDAMRQALIDLRDA